MSAATARASRWVTALATTLVIAVVLAAFALSFTVLRDLAALAGIPVSVAWLWPVIADGTIAAATLVLYGSRGGGHAARRLPLVALVLFVLVSIVGNVAHILLDEGRHAIPWPLSVFVGVVPPVGLFLTVELLVSLLRAGGSGAGAEPPAEDADQATDLADSTADELTTAAHQVADRTAEVTDEPSQLTAALTVSGGAAHESVDQVTDLAEAADGPDGTPAAVPELVTPALVIPAIDQEPAEEETDPVPREKAEQVQWIVDRARAGSDVSKRALLRAFEESGQPASDSTVQRRLREAREIDPAAFAA